MVFRPLSSPSKEKAQVLLLEWRTQDKLRTVLVARFSSSAPTHAEKFSFTMWYAYKGPSPPTQQGSVSILPLDQRPEQDLTAPGQAVQNLECIAVCVRTVPPVKEYQQPDSWALLSWPGQWGVRCCQSDGTLGPSEWLGQFGSRGGPAHNMGPGSHVHSLCSSSLPKVCLLLAMQGRCFNFYEVFLWDCLACRVLWSS